MPHLALYQPDIPQNTGTMLRLAACLGVPVAIIEPAGFDVSDRNFRRAGLDYLDQVAIARHPSWRAFQAWRAADGRRLVLATTRAATAYTDFAWIAKRHGVQSRDAQFHMASEVAASIVSSVAAH